MASGEERERRVGTHELLGEVLESRDRLRDIEVSLAGVVENCRRVNERLDGLEPQVTRLERASEIADAVDAKLKARGDVIQIRWLGKGLAALIALSSFVAVVLQLVAAFEGR